MAIQTIPDTAIKQIVNDSYKQFTGKDDVDTIDLSDFADTGVSDVAALREKFTGVLLAQSTRWYMDTAYHDTTNDIFYEDSEKFGAITEMISATVPEVKDNSAWKTFTSGTTTVGQYTVYLPVVDTKYYVKSDSWALPITITGEQWDTAFKSESALNSFVAYLIMMVDNAVEQHLEDMSAMNRNNFIASKIRYAASQDATGIHVVDLVAEYVKSIGKEDENMTVEEYMNNADGLLFAEEQFGLYKGYMSKQTCLFNTEGKVRFTPKERMVVQVLDMFVKRVDRVAKSTIFHNELVKMPLYRSVSAWQGLQSLDFGELSKIDVKLGDEKGDTITKSGIVGMIVDKWAIIHTIRSNRVASQHFNIENITHYEYQHRDEYLNNLAMNGVIFVVNDYTAPTI